MDKLFYNGFELSASEKEKWVRHKLLVEHFEKGIEIDEIARIVGLTEEETEELFPRLY